MTGQIVLTSERGVNRRVALRLPRQSILP